MDSPVINRMLADRDKLLSKIQTLEKELEKKNQLVYLLRERNFRLRKQHQLDKEKAGV